MKIIIIKTSSLGDIIQAFPVIDYLKGAAPGAAIDWIVEKPFSELLNAHPSINKVLAIDSKKWRKISELTNSLKEIAQFKKLLREEKYDIAIDLQGNIKSGVAMGMANAKQKIGFGLKTVPEWPNLFFSNKRVNPPDGRNMREDYITLAQKAVPSSHVIIKKQLLNISPEELRKIDLLLASNPLHDNEKILVCPGSAWKNKQLAAGTLSEFLRLLSLSKPRAFYFLWGNPEEQKICQELKALFPGNGILMEKLPLPTLQNFMDKLDVVLSMDSLPLHLAATTSVKTFAFFGASSAAKYNPVGNGHGFYQGLCPYGKKFTKRCPILRTCKTGACIRSLEAEQLFQAFQDWYRSAST